ncbi:hypothetical protein EI613_14960 [Azospirillum sp. 412522]|nr:hypothetical protein [Azospirillum sp. 412522]MBY6263204.1 hypothetical protein [Azospirillum sp. 412522]
MPLDSRTFQNDHFPLWAEEPPVPSEGSLVPGSQFHEEQWIMAAGMLALGNPLARSFHPRCPLTQPLCRATGRRRRNGTAAGNRSMLFHLPPDEGRIVPKRPAQRRSSANRLKLFPPLPIW